MLKPTLQEYKNLSPGNPGEENGRKPENESSKQYPGYPHYPASEDISNPSNSKQVSLDQLNPDDKVIINQAEDTNTREEDDDIEIVPGTEADVTEEDLELLGPKDGDMDMGDDELLRGKIQPIGRTDEDLDIPGSELDDEDEVIGEEDEENNYYSLGGDRHEDLEEDNQQ